MSGSQIYLIILLKTFSLKSARREQIIWDNFFYINIYLFIKQTKTTVCQKMILVVFVAQTLVCLTSATSSLTTCISPTLAD